METETVSSLIKFREKGNISHSFAIEESVSYKLYIENSRDIRIRFLWNIFSVIDMFKGLSFDGNATSMIISATYTFPDS